MRVVARLSLQRAWLRIVALTLGGGVFVFVVGLSYASIDQNAVRSLVASLPPVLRVLTGATQLASPAGYLGAAYAHPVVLAALGAVVVSMATAPARDRDSGAAELVLSRPLPPWRWLAGQVIALFAGLVAVLAGACAGGLAAVAAVGDLAPVRPADLGLVVLATGLVFAAVAGVSLVIGVLARNAGVAVGLSAGFLVVSYALNYLAQVWSVARPLGRLSVFHRFDPGLVLFEGRIPIVPALVLAAVAVVGVVGAHLLVGRRELTAT